MSNGSGGLFGATADATAAWDDETRTAFDKRYLQPIERTMAEYQEAAAAVQQVIEAIQKFFERLDDL